MTNNAILKRTVQTQAADTQSKKEDTRDIVAGYIVEVNGSIYGPNQNFVWFKDYQTNTQPRLIRGGTELQDLRVNTRVLVERNPKAPYPWRIIMIDRDREYLNGNVIDTLPGSVGQPHRHNHEWIPGRPGADVVRVFPRAITQLQVQPTNPASMRLVISGGWYQSGFNWTRYKGPVYTADLTSRVPSTTGAARLVAIALDIEGTLHYFNGADFANGQVPGTNHYPSVPRELLLLTAVKLHQGMTTVTEIAFEYEMRPLIDAPFSDDIPLVKEGDEGSHFLDNDSSFPNGWTEVDAAEESNTNTVFSYWYLVGSNAETSWKYRYQTSTHLENDVLGGGTASFLVGPILFRLQEFNADVDYYFGIYRDLAGIDENTFCRIHLQWDNAGSQWRARGEVKDASSGTQHDGTWVNFSELTDNKLWLGLVVTNDIAKKCISYIGHHYTPGVPLQFMRLIQSQDPTTATVWSNIWLQFHQTRSTGARDRLVIGAWDRLF